MDIIEDNLHSNMKRSSNVDLESECSFINVSPECFDRTDDVITTFEHQAHLAALSRPNSPELNLHSRLEKSDPLPSLFDLFQPERSLPARRRTNRLPFDDDNIDNRLASESTRSLSAQTPRSSISSSVLQDHLLLDTSAVYKDSSSSTFPPRQLATITPTAEHCHPYNQDSFQYRVAGISDERSSGHVLTGEADNCGSIKGTPQGFFGPSNQNNYSPVMKSSKFLSPTYPFSHIDNSGSPGPAFRTLLKCTEDRISEDYMFRNIPRVSFSNMQVEAQSPSNLSSYFSLDAFANNKDLRNQRHFEERRNLASCDFMIPTAQSQYHHDNHYRRMYLHMNRNGIPQPSERQWTQLPASNTFPFGTAMSSFRENDTPEASQVHYAWPNAINVQKQYPTSISSETFQENNLHSGYDENIIEEFLSSTNPSDKTSDFDANLIADDAKDDLESDKDNCPSQGKLVKAYLRSSEKNLVTDFTYTVMTQLVVVKFDHKDRRGNRGKTEDGFPGLACRYCKGATGRTGRYFPTTIRTLADSKKTLFSVNRHLMECKKCPTDVKKYLRSRFCSHLKEKQEKRQRHGSIRTFYRRIWDIMHEDDESPSPK